MLFFSTHNNKKITSFEKRESLSSVCRFPNKERKGKKATLQNFFCPIHFIFATFCHKTRQKNTTTGVDKGERTGDDDDGEDDEEKARDVF